MTLAQTIMEDMKNAMKAHDADTLGTIRLLRSEIKNFEIDNGVQDDAGVQKIVVRMIKQWKDAIEEYKKGNREDLVAEAEVKIKVLERYLPAQLSEDEVKKIVQEVITQSGQTQMGPVIGMVMKKVAGQADGGLVSRLVKEALNSLTAK